MASSHFELLAGEDVYTASPIHHPAMNTMIAVTQLIVTRMVAVYRPRQDMAPSQPTIWLTQHSRAASAVDTWRIPAYKRRRQARR